MKKVVIIILLSISLYFSFLIYKNYHKKEEIYTKIYLVQAGAYKNLENASLASEKFENSIIRKEGDLYKIFIGVTKDNEVYDKLVSLYIGNDNNFKRVLKVTNEEFENNLQNYDKIIKNTDKKKEINLVVKASLQELEKLLNTSKI